MSGYNNNIIYDTELSNISIKLTHYIYTASYCSKSNQVSYNIDWLKTKIVPKLEIMKRKKC